MISEDSLKAAMNSIISINIFDRLWIVVCVTALAVFLLPFCFVLFDVLRVNVELFQLRARKAFREMNNLSAPHNEELTSFCYKHTAMNASIVESIVKEVGHYLPPWWYSSHLGTLVAFGFDPQLNYETETVKAAGDDDSFALSWYPAKPNKLCVSEEIVRDIIVFFPGLGLSARSKVTQQVVRVAAESGFVVVVVGARGLETPLTSTRPWHPGFYEDAVSAVELVFRLYGKSGANIFLLGYSAGSNLVHKTLLYFDQQRQQRKSSNNHNRDSDSDIPRIAAASCVCINYDYLKARERLERSFIGIIYSMLMCAMCKEMLQKNAHVYPEGMVTVSEGKEGEREGVLLSQLLSKCLLLSHYDEIMGLTVHGYSSHSHLQESLSMFNFQDIATPLLALQPSDDPLHMGEVRNNIQLDKVIDNPNVIYVESKYGNHFGFYEGNVTEAFSSKTSYTYPPKLAIHFFKKILQHQRQEAEKR